MRVLALSYIIPYRKPVPRSAPELASPPLVRYGRRPLALRELACLPISSGWTQPSRPVESNSRTTIGSRVDKDCSSGHARIVRATHHLLQRHLLWTSLAGTLAIPASWRSRMGLLPSTTPPVKQLTGCQQPSDQAPSLHCHYSNFPATTGLSAPVQRVDTVSLTGSLLAPFSCHRCDRFPQFNMRAQIKLTPPLCRVPPGQCTGLRQIHPEATSTPRF